MTVGKKVNTAAGKKTVPLREKKEHNDNSSSASGHKLKKGASGVAGRLRKKRADNMLACRYELKYRISESKAQAIRRFIKPYLHPDRYAKLQPDGTYPIVSLYFDSNFLHLAKETIEGKKNRFKLRIRGYSDDSQAPRFFEIKRRINNVILKSRSRVQHEDVDGILSRKSIMLPDHCSDKKTLRQFQLYVDSLNAKPRVLVRYDREAFEGDSDNRVRITFDRQLGYKATSDLYVSMGGAGWNRVLMEFVILEIKFTSRYPAWLSQMVKAFDLRQGAMSKYVESVKHSCSMGFYAPQIMV